MTLLVLGVGPDGAALAAAAVSAGLGELAPDHERLLVLRDDRPDAEAFAPLAPGPRVTRAFDRVVSLNDTLGWVHPRAFTPRGESLAVLEAMLRSAWHLRGALTIAADAHDDDGRLLWRVFPGASLAAFVAPGRERAGWDAGLPRSLAQRVCAVVDVPGAAREGGRRATRETAPDAAREAAT